MMSVAAPDRLAPELDVRRRPAVERPLDRPLEAQDFLDGSGQQGRVGPHELELLRMGKEVEHRVADQADGRLVAGDDEEHDGAEQLVLAEGVALVSGTDEGADQIVPRLGAAFGEEILQVRHELGHLLEEALQRLRLEHGRDDRVRPGPEPFLIGGRHAEELGDDGNRQRKRVLRREVHLTARLDGVEQLVGDRLDARPQLLDHPRREGLRHESPQAAVIVAVSVQHVVLERLHGGRGSALRELFRGQSEARIAHEALVVEKNGGDVVVARHEPDHRLAVDSRLAEDGVVRPHRGEDRVRIRAEGRSVEVVLPLGRGHASSLTTATQPA